MFFILLGIGAESPAVLQEFEDANGANVVYFRKHGVNAYHPEFELTPEHQVFWLDLQLSTGNGLLKEMADADETTVDIDLDLTVVVKVTTKKPLNVEAAELFSCATIVFGVNNCRRTNTKSSSFPGFIAHVCSLDCLCSLAAKMIARVGVG